MNNEGLKSIKGHRVDVNDMQSSQVFFSRLMTEGRPPDVLINNAGITVDKMFHRMKREEWRDVMETNLLSLFNLTQLAFKIMRDRKFGRIINISSINAHKGQLGQTNYSASKAGIIGFTKSLALEGARYGITVNSISPGYTETDMVTEMSSEILQGIIANIPLGRLGKPNDVANAAAFLISECSEYITGADIPVNGGMYL
jgi:acetoacetyl-CoA reductase